MFRKRKEYGFADRTFIYPIRLDQLPYYQHRDKIERILVGGGQSQGLDRTKDSDLFFILMWSKLWFINQAVEINIFSSSKFSWIDFAIFKLLEGKEDQSFHQLQASLTTLPDDLIKVAIVAETHPREVEDRRVWYGTHRYKMVCGFFGGGRENLQWFYQKFDEETRKCINSGYIGLEEMMFTFIYTIHKNRFLRCYGEYYDVIQAFSGSGQLRLYNITNNLLHCRGYEMWDEIKNIGKVVTSHSSLDLSPLIDRLAFYDELLISCWYANDKEMSLLAGKHLIDLLEEHEDVVDHIDLERIKGNLEHHHLKLSSKFD